MSEELIWFWLFPANVAAQKVVNDRSNHSCVQRDPADWSRAAIRVGFANEPKDPTRLLSFGRDSERNDVILAGPQFDKDQCHFFVNEESGELLLRDTSPRNTTKLLADVEREKFQLGGVLRQCVVRAAGNLRLVINEAVFRFHWSNHQHADGSQAFFAAKTGFAARSKLAITSTALGPVRQMDQAMVTELPMVPDDNTRLGAGSYGKVSLVVDVRTGNHVAVKIVEHHPPQEFKRVGRHGQSKLICEEKIWKGKLKREVQMLANLRHPRIAEFRYSQGWRLGEPVEIFMTAYPGNLTELILNHDYSSSSEPPFYIPMAKQMLEALAFLHEHDIIHRDIKPDNILFNRDSSGGYNFYLADFGVAKHQDLSRTQAGSPTFWAPEVLRGSADQTSKADVWSLGVVFLACNNIRAGHDGDRWFARIKELVNSSLSYLAPMLNEDADKRFTAKECIQRFFPQEQHLLPWGGQKPEPSRSIINQTSSGEPGRGLKRESLEPSFDLAAGPVSKKQKTVPVARPVSSSRRTKSAMKPVLKRRKRVPKDNRQIDEEKEEEEEEEL
ncbi:MAG: hypothetical protein M1816_004191 [Peltula sp. TS41687]|nr:MAG: hypothetical protein M1816_004191 [Peltula sp. TS41687]